MDAASSGATPPVTRSDADVAVSLRGVCVSYRVQRERVYSFKHFAIQWLKRRISYDTVLALQDVSLDVMRGETLGLIGSNGSGKSTLLKVIARVLRPTTGRVKVFGRVSPLLELGAGFDPELTGRENVFLNGAILGYRRKDIVQRFDRIVDFAELREFIGQPIRTYSSGMLMRLGFAVAVDVTPDILIVDEVMAVGDAEFRRKSGERLAEIRKGGATVLLVSHDMQTVTDLCSRVVWLERGRVRAVGPAGEVVASYESAAGPKPGTA